ncbi:MAG: acyltransferase [Acidobacteriota bacterium]
MSLEVSTLPIDREHAFATGPVTREVDARLGWFLRWLGAAVSRLLDRYRSHVCWRAFARNVTAGDGLALGTRAWCENGGSPADIRLGKNVVCRGVLRREAFGSGAIDLGDDVYIGDDCIISCANRVTIGPGTLVAHGVQIFDNDTHSLDAEARRRHWNAIREGGHVSDVEVPGAPIEIGAGAWIGFGSIILKGVTLGDECIVAAGSVVTSNVAPRTLVAGNPAREVRAIG